MGAESIAYLPNTNIKDIEHVVYAISDDHKYQIDNSQGVELFNSISFKYKGEGRILYCHNLDLRYKEKREYFKSQGWSESEVEEELGIYEEDGLPLNTNGIQIRLNFWGSSVEILRNFCLVYGGYVMPNDSEKGKDKYNKVYRDNPSLWELIVRCFK